MTATLRVVSRAPRITLDGILVAVVIGLTLATAASALVPGLHLRLYAPALDLMLDTLTMVVTLGVAAAAWVRYVQRGEPVALFQAAAFLVLGVGNSLTVVLMTSGLDAHAGMALTDPGQAPLYLFTLPRILAGALLILGGIASLRSWHVGHAAAIVLGPAVGVLMATALIEAGAAWLPSLGSVGPVVSPPGGPSPLPTPTLLGATIQVLAAALFLWAAALSRRLYRRDGTVADGYLAVGLVFAAFAQIQAAIYPGTYTGLVTGGDLMRLAFDVILLLGIQVEAGVALARLRRSNEDLTRLAALETERSALEERTRLSRELHDGLAQDLWLAKLRIGRLAAMPDLTPEARALTSELGQAIDAGLGDAQQAVAALRGSREAAGTLCEVMSRSVHEFADRFGLRVEVECQPDLPELSARAQAEALRIAQEALTNVRRHADATVVRVRAGVEDGRLTVTVADNGRGFDLDSVDETAYGLAGMRERAALIGGELRIDSRPRDGTRVSLLVPLALAMAPVRGGTQ